MLASSFPAKSTGLTGYASVKKSSAESAAPQIGRDLCHQGEAQDLPSSTLAVGQVCGGRRNTTLRHMPPPLAPVMTLFQYTYEQFQQKSLLDRLEEQKIERFQNVSEQD